MRAEETELDTSQNRPLLSPFAWGSSSVWQSAAFAMRRSGVRSPSAPPKRFNHIQPAARLAFPLPWQDCGGLPCPALDGHPLALRNRVYVAQTCPDVGVPHQLLYLEGVRAGYA